MAAATTIIAGVAIAAGAAQATKGIIDTSKANDAINNYQRQDLTNSAEKIQISTAGSDLIREEGARTTNSLIGAVKRGGARAITGNVGRIAATNSKYNQRASADLDQQIQRRNSLIAQENTRIQHMYERREESDLEGLAAQLEASRKTTWAGFSTMQKGINYGAQNGMFGEAGEGVGEMPELFDPNTNLNQTYVQNNGTYSNGMNS